jgi:hypothetical protein
MQQLNRCFYFVLSAFALLVRSSHGFLLVPHTSRQYNRKNFAVPSMRLFAVFPDPAAATSIDMIVTTSSVLAASSSWLATTETASQLTEAAATEGLSRTTNVLVFLAGVFPFAWATVDFWRRIAVGDSFGTGADSVVFSIGEDDAPESSRGRRVLGKGAMITAYILFAIAFGIIALVLVAVITTDQDSMTGTLSQ